MGEVTNVSWDDVTDADPIADIINAKNKMEDGVSAHPEPYCYLTKKRPDGKEVSFAFCMIFCHSKYFKKCYNR